MIKVKGGDLDKMRLLFERYHRVLFSFLYHSTHQKTLSEDMVQTVFYRMLKYRHTFKGEGEFKTWMYHLARNVLNDEFRKSKNLSFKENLLDKHISEDSPESTLDDKEEQAALQNALDKLSSDHREVLILSRYQDLSYKEIAGILMITEANVKVKVHRAIKELRNIFLKEIN